MLECPKCGRDNELGRIFCAKCGEKLDLKKVGVPSEIRRMAQKGVRGIPFGRRILLMIKKLVQVVILAAVAAFLTLLYLPPNFQNKGVSAQHFEAYKEKRGRLEEAVNAQQNAQIVFEESDLNAALAEAIHRTFKGGDKTKGPQLERVCLSLEDGAILVTVQQKWKWFRVAAQIRVKPEEKNGAWQFRPQQAWIGRFPVPSWLPQPVLDSVAGAFKAIWQNYETERQWLEQLRSIEVKTGRVILITKTES